MNKKRVQVWVDPLFHKELKICSAINGKKIEDITKDIGLSLEEKRTTKKKRDYEFL